MYQYNSGVIFTILCNILLFIKKGVNNELSPLKEKGLVPNTVSVEEYKELQNKYKKGKRWFSFSFFNY